MPAVDQKTIETLEAHIRKGNYASVRDFLRNVSRHEIPDHLILRLSQLARRIDYPKKGIILLRDRVIDLPAHQRPRPAEQAEYAACLLKLGAVTEARRLLSETPDSATPEALKFLAFTYVHQYDYAAVVPLLKKYIDRPDVNPYERLIGAVNLSAALIEIENYSEAHQLLDSITGQARAQGHQLLFGNICELLAQIQILTGKFNKAYEFLDQAWQALHNAQPRYRLYLQKWQAIAGLMQNSRDTKALSSLRTVRSEASKRRDFDVIRECDFYESWILKNQTMLTHLYFGTPYTPYRQKILRRNGGELKLPETYIWGRSKHSVINLDTGYDLDQHGILKKGQALHRMACALALDFYAPAPVAQLFANVFENEKFHPESAPHRVYELLRRLRGILKKTGYNLELISSNHGYKMDMPASDFSFEVKANRNMGSILEEIRNLFQHSEFRLRELSERIGIPHTTLYRELKRLISDGSIEVLGEGKQAKYRLAKCGSAAA